jgi:hypothetical protein
MTTQTQPKHTPGPWKAEGKQIEPTRGHRVEYVLSTNEDGVIAQVWTPSDANTDKRAANARLIAAAPDLLAFARECARADSDCGEGIRNAARAAIAKAEGGGA